VARGCLGCRRPAALAWFIVVPRALSDRRCEEIATALKDWAAQDGEQDAFLLGGTSNNGDPDDLLTNHLSCAGAKAGSNRTRWCFKPYDDFLDQARRIADQGERKALYVKAQEIVREEVPLLPIAHALVFMPIRKEVRGYVLDPFGRQNFSKVDLAN
jgi:dipeptide transport system substrate-binding protein